MINLLRPLLLIGFFVPWMYIYIWTADSFEEWTAIGLGLGQLACILAVLIWDDGSYIKYKKDRRKLNNK